MANVQSPIVTKCGGQPLEDCGSQRVRRLLISAWPTVILTYARYLPDVDYSRNVLFLTLKDVRMSRTLAEQFEPLASRSCGQDRPTLVSTLLILGSGQTGDKHDAAAMHPWYTDGWQAELKRYAWLGERRRPSSLEEVSYQRLAGLGTMSPSPTFTVDPGRNQTDSRNSIDQSLPR